jgi:hypothetical protein
MGFEPEAARYVTLVAFLRDEVLVDLEQDVGERGAEVGAVDAGVAGGLGAVDILAFGAVKLDALGVGEVAQANWEEGVGPAEHTRAPAEVAFLIFLHLGSVLAGSKREDASATDHLLQPSRCDDVPRVNKPVQVSRRLLDLLADVIVTVEVEHVGDEVESILVVLDFGLQTRQVEAVR